MTWWQWYIHELVAMIAADPTCVLNLKIPFIVDDMAYSWKALVARAKCYALLEGVSLRIRLFVLSYLAHRD